MCAVSIKDASNCMACVLSNCTYVQEMYGEKCANIRGKDQFTSYSAAKFFADCFKII